MSTRTLIYLVLLICTAFSIVGAISGETVAIVSLALSPVAAILWEYAYRICDDEERRNFHLSPWQLLKKFFVFFFTPPPPPPEPPTYDDFLNVVNNRYVAKCKENGLPTVSGKVADNLAPIVLYIFENIPDYDHALTIAIETVMVFSYYRPSNTSTPFADVPLYDLIDTKNAIAHVRGLMFKDEAKPLEDLRKQLNINQKTVSIKELGEHNAENRGQRLKVENYSGDAQASVDLYLKDTIFTEVFYSPVPFGIDDQIRFEHMWLTGNQGAGKTTLLTTFINADLDRVARGECAIVVMDSQNTLVPNLARLKRFAPGGDLEGKLIYIKPDPDYPLALNVFDGTDASASTLINFFIRSGLKGDTSGNMDTILNYLIPATTAIPNATIFTLGHLLNGGYLTYHDHFTGLDREVQDWLAMRLNPKNQGTLKASFDALSSRIEGFGSHKLFRRMFRSPNSNLDLGKELSEPKVIVIDTNEADLENMTEAFGRLFIALFFQAARQRMNTGNRFPTFFYVDEAKDYIADEEKVRDIINKSRKQNAGLILATQSESDITSSVVLSAVKRASIQAKAVARGTAQLTIRGRPVSLPIQPVDFAEMPRMTDREWQTIVEDMRSRFTADPPEIPTEAKAPAQEW